MNKQLINKIQANTTSVGAVGLGHVGLSHALRFAEVGIKMLGFDIVQAKGAHIDYTAPWGRCSPQCESSILT